MPVATQKLRLAAILGSLAWLLLLASGCAARGPTLGMLRGERLLVQGGEREREDRVARALATAPVRVWPADADAERPDPGGGRDFAERRRLPWLLVEEGRLLRVETARGGRRVWEAELPEGAPPELAAARLREALAGRRRRDAVVDRGDARLAAAGELRDLRAAAAGGDLSLWRAGTERLLAEFPADPALRAHEALMLDLRGDPESGAALLRARAMNPDGESEWLALAMAAESAGNVALALRARETLARVYPERLDYLAGLGDAVAAVDGAALAARRLRLAIEAVPEPQRAGLAATPLGTAPEEAPDALPLADAHYNLGWQLAQAGRPGEAPESYQAAISLYEKMGRPLEQAEALNNAGVALVEAGRPLLAGRALQQALALRERHGAPSLALANTRYNIARALADAERGEEALAAYAEAAAAYEAAGDLSQALDAEVESLPLRLRSGDRDAFVAAARAVAERSASAAMPAQQAGALFELGQGLVSFGQPERALGPLQEALGLYREAGDRLSEGQTHYVLALPNLALFRFRDAWAELLEAARIALELGDGESLDAIRDQIGKIGGLMEMKGEEVPEIPGDLRDCLRAE
jgi:tetratricopeptide (TPR) repeat protein